MNDIYYLKGAVACPLSGPADGGKPKWATLTPGKLIYKAVLNSKYFHMFHCFVVLEKLNSVLVSRPCAMAGNFGFRGLIG